MSDHRRHSRLVGVRCELVVVLVILTLATSWVGLAQSALFARNQRAREIVKTPDNGPARQGMLVTVVAVPGDQITADNDRLRVNGRLVEGFSVELIAMVAGSKRRPKEIGEGYYLVMGEYAAADGNVVRKWGTYVGNALEAVTEPGR